MYFLKSRLSVLLFSNQTCHFLGSLKNRSDFWGTETTGVSRVSSFMLISLENATFSGVLKISDFQEPS